MPGGHRGLRAPLQVVHEPAALTPQQARRLAVRGALLSAPRPDATREGILEVVSRLGGLQIDPTQTVERTQLLVLWSRLGPFDRGILERLLWEERALFEYQAYISRVEDYPEKLFFMRRFGMSDEPWDRRVRDWLATNDRFRRHVLDGLEAEGPLPSRAFVPGADVVPWQSSGWTHGRDASQMLEFLHRSGHVMVAARRKNERLWDVADRVLPAWTPRDELDEAGYAARRIPSVIRRLGVATERDLRQRVWGVPLAVFRSVLRRLIDERVLERAGESIVETPGSERLADVTGRAWRPRTTLLSPFDPLIYDRARTERLFGFKYRLEMYVPKEKREFGHFVLPIVHGERLIGRVDPTFDRRAGVLQVRLHREPDAPRSAAIDGAIHRALDELGRFVGAAEVRSEEAERRPS